MTTTYAAYSDDLLSLRQTFDVHFYPKGKGTVAIDDLFSDTVPPGPTVMAAIEPDKTICIAFNSVISRLAGKAFTICQPCSSYS